MKSTIKTLFVLSLCSLIFASCNKEDEDGENELKIEFKTGTGYTFSNATLLGGSVFKIGIEAETEKPQDPIIKFNITESVNGAAGSTVYQEDLSDVDYEYDYMDTLGTTSGETHQYTFTITNRDGFNKQVSLTITVQ